LLLYSIYLNGKTSHLFKWQLSTTIGGFRFYSLDTF
jgi:hypothetical protein